MSRKVKRVMDVCTSSLALAILALPMALIALLILIADGRPIGFRQQRPGYLGRPFTLLKFRTMSARRDERGSLAADGERITALGRFLRRYSFDELPQLLNVLRGDMSLVGPRPLLMQYMERYTPEQARRHEVVPGITGWAQVNGRNALNWPERLALDVWYVDHWSLALDGRIMLMTLGRIFKPVDITQAGEATMSEFMGNERSASES